MHLTYLSRMLNYRNKPIIPFQKHGLQNEKFKLFLSKIKSKTFGRLNYDDDN